MAVNEIDNIPLVPGSNLRWRDLDDVVVRVQPNLIQMERLNLVLWLQTKMRAEYFFACVISGIGFGLIPIFMRAFGSSLPGWGASSLAFVAGVNSLILAADGYRNDLDTELRPAIRSAHLAGVNCQWGGAKDEKSMFIKTLSSGLVSTIFAIPAVEFSGSTVVSIASRFALAYFTGKSFYEYKQASRLPDLVPV